MLRRLFGRGVQRKSPMQRRPALFLEGLEDRCVPTVTGVINDGSLTITGDTGANSIILTEQPTAGTYQVQGLTSGTQTFTAVTSIVCNLRQTGNDVVTINGNASNTGLTGSLLITSDGDLTVNVNDNVKIIGRSTINHTGLQGLTANLSGAGIRLGELVVTDGAGSSSFTIQNKARLSGFASFSMGAGDNMVSVLSGAQIAHYLSYVGGTANDSLQLNGAVVRENLAMAGAEGTNQTIIQASVINGNVLHTSAGIGDTVSLANGTALKGSFTVSESGATGTNSVAILSGTAVGGAVSVTGASANESFQLSNSSVRGNATLNLAAGNGTIVVDSSAVLIGNLLHTGSGNTAYTQQSGAKIQGYVSLNVSGSANVTATADSAIVGGFFSAVAASGTGMETLTNSNIGNAVALAMGSGNATFNVSGGHVSGKLIQTGSGNVTLNLNSQARIDGGISLNTTGTSALTVNASNASVRGFLSAVSGSGDDNLALTNLSVGGNVALVLGGGINSTTFTTSRFGGTLTVSGSGVTNLTSDSSTVGGSTTITGGSGTDTITLTNFASAAGDLTVALGAGSNIVNLTDADLEGSFVANVAGTTTLNLDGNNVQVDLKVNAQTAAGVLTLNLSDTLVNGRLAVSTGTAADVLKLTNVVVNGTTSIASGDAADVLTTNGAVFHGTASIDLGAGNDTFNVEATTGSDSISTSFYADLAFTGGNDDDTVKLGLDADDLALFFAAATLDGGSGTNNITQTFAVYLGSAASISNFS